MGSLSRHDLICLAYLIYLLVLSIITLIAYGVDKSKAKNGQYRTKEKTLLLLSILGGAFGGYFGMLIFHHKTKREHWYFSFVNVLFIIIHTAILFVLIFTIPR